MTTMSSSLVAQCVVNIDKPDGMPDASLALSCLLRLQPQASGKQRERLAGVFALSNDSIEYFTWLE